MRAYCQLPSGIRVTFLLLIYSVLYHYVIDIVAATRRRCLPIAFGWHLFAAACHLIYVRLLNYGENIEKSKWKKPRPIKQSVFKNFEIRVRTEVARTVRSTTFVITRAFPKRHRVGRNKQTEKTTPRDIFFDSALNRRAISLGVMSIWWCCCSHPLLLGQCKPSLKRFVCFSIRVRNRAYGAFVEIPFCGKREKHRCRENADSNFVSQPSCGQKRRDNVKRPVFTTSKQIEFLQVGDDRLRVPARYTSTPKFARSDNTAQRRLKYRRNRSQHIVPNRLISWTT